jgi:hypothetical protein
MSFLSKALSAASPADSLKPELLGSIRVAVVGEPSVGKTALTEVSQLGIMLLQDSIVCFGCFSKHRVCGRRPVPHRRQYVRVSKHWKACWLQWTQELLLPLNIKPDTMPASGFCIPNTSMQTAHTLMAVCQPWPFLQQQLAHPVVVKPSPLVGLCEPILEHVLIVRLLRLACVVAVLCS